MGKMYAERGRDRASSKDMGAASSRPPRDPYAPKDPYGADKYGAKGAYSADPRAAASKSSAKYDERDPRAPPPRERDDGRYEGDASRYGRGERGAERQPHYSKHGHALEPAEIYAAKKYGLPVSGDARDPRAAGGDPRDPRADRGDRGERYGGSSSAYAGGKGGEDTRITGDPRDPYGKHARREKETAAQGYGAPHAPDPYGSYGKDSYGAGKDSKYAPSSKYG